MPSPSPPRSLQAIRDRYNEADADISHPLHDAVADVALLFAELTAVEALHAEARQALHLSQQRTIDTEVLCGAEILKLREELESTTLELHRLQTDVLRAQKENHEQ